MIGVVIYSNSWQSYNIFLEVSMDFEDDNKSEGDMENIEEMLDDLGLGDDAANYEVSKKDSTVFMVDCSRYMLDKMGDEEKSQLQLIF